MMRLNKKLCGRLVRTEKLLFILIMLLFGVPLHAQNSGSGASGKFKQRIEWNADKNAFEYKVEIRQNGKIIQTLSTSDNYIDLNLPSGSYEYRVSVYDFLGRVQDSSKWQMFEISKASTPAFENVDAIDGGIELENVTAGTSVSLVNVVTGEVINGSLKMSGSVSGKSETGKATVDFPEIPEGEWKLVVKNPSGFTAESQIITVTKPEEPVAVVESEVVEPETAVAVVEPEPPVVEPEIAVVEPVETTEDAVVELSQSDSIETTTDETTDETTNTELEMHPLTKAKGLGISTETTGDLDQSEESDLEEPEDDLDSKPERKIFGVEIKAGAALALSLFKDDILSRKNYDMIFKSENMNKMNLAPYAAVSFVPDSGWKINPGIELSAHYFNNVYVSPSYGNWGWEYRQNFSFFSTQIKAVGQFKVHPQKFFVNLKAGGGLENIRLLTEFYKMRQNEQDTFIYPKISVGLSMEFVPLKHLVIETGADYNKILSSKVNVSYLLPYVVVGVRF